MTKTGAQSVTKENRIFVLIFVGGLSLIISTYSIQDGLLREVASLSLLGRRGGGFGFLLFFSKI